MKIFRVLVVAVFVGLFSQPLWAQELKPLTDLTPVTLGDTIRQDQPFSIGGRVMHFGLQLGVNGHSSSTVYDLGGKYARLEAWIGVGDNYKYNKDCGCSIFTDGKVVFDNKDALLSFEDPPVHVTLDVSGAQSIRIMGDNGVFVGEPTLYKTTPQTSGIATLIAPTDETQVAGSSVNLLWEPVTGAMSYGVEIVCTKGSSPHIYALNVTGGDSNTKFDLTNVPNGEYHWSVIAFDSKGVMGKFSKDRTFIVAK